MDLIEVFDALRRHTSSSTRSGGGSGGGFDCMVADRDRVVRCFNDLLETGPKPTVAAVEKAALGGGFEICLACNALVTTPDALLGLPELRVGILPDFGGVQRLIRLLPTRKALDMMLCSTSVRGKDAFKNGELVDVVVAEPSKLITAAKEIALEMARGVRHRRQALLIARDMNWRGEAEYAVQESRLKKMYPWNVSKHAAEMLLNCVEIGILRGPGAGQECSKHANSVLSKQLSHKSAVRAFGAHHRARHAHSGLRHLFLSCWAWLLGIVAVGAAAGTHLQT